MPDETIELTEVQSVLGELSSPTDEQLMQAVRGYSERAIGSAAAKLALEGGGGGGEIPDLGDVLEEDNSANGLKITNLDDPADAQDAATKAYADQFQPVLEKGMPDGYAGMDGDGFLDATLKDDSVSTDHIIDGAVTAAKLSGFPRLTNATAPDDGDIAASELYFWYDDDDDEPTLNVKAKTADGSIATATIPLAPA